MFSKVKTTAYWVSVGLNIIAIVAMWLVGNVDRLNPVEHPMWANLGLGFPVLLAVNLGFLVFWTFTRIRTVWLPVLGLLVCYAPVRRYIPFNYPSDPPQNALKVMSFNVLMFAPWGLQEGESNPIVEYICKSKADIVCLQESSAYEAGADEVYNELKAHYPHVDIVNMPPPGNQNMILLSRFPILGKERIPYESVGNMSMAYFVDYNGTEVAVINNHFESYHLSEEDKEGYKEIVKKPFEGKDSKDVSFRLLRKLGEASAIRAPQADSVAAFVRKCKARRLPVILCGDFNDNPISYVHRTMENELTDCYIESGNGPGISYHKTGMYFRIDHIFCSDDFEPYGAKVDDEVKTSDHYPIYTWLKYKPKP